MREKAIEQGHCFVPFFSSGLFEPRNPSSSRNLIRVFYPYQLSLADQLIYGVGVQDETTRQVSHPSQTGVRRLASSQLVAPVGLGALTMRTIQRVWGRSRKETLNTVVGRRTRLTRGRGYFVGSIVRDLVGWEGGGRVWGLGLWGGVGFHSGGRMHWLELVHLGFHRFHLV